LGHPAFDRRAAVVRLGDLVPDLDLVRLVLGEDDQSFVVLLGLEVDLDLLADLGQAARVPELLDGDRALALVADVDEHLAVAHLDHAAADDLALLDVAHAAVDPLLHALLGGLHPLLRSAREGPRLPIVALRHDATSPLDLFCRPRDRVADIPACFRPAPAGPGDPRSPASSPE